MIILDDYGWGIFYIWLMLTDLQKVVNSTWAWEI